MVDMPIFPFGGCGLTMERFLVAIMSTLRALALLLAVAAQPVLGQGTDVENLPTPSRVGMVSGAASFWRPGAEDWSPAQVNMPLAAGDALYTAAGATLEVQIGSRAYLRLAQNAMLTLLNDEPGLQQYKITSGIAALDLRGMPAGRAIEIDTPAGAFNIDSAGYYRVEIADNATHFIVRRGGEATVTLADGGSRLIAPSQEAVVEAGDGVSDVGTYVAPEPDAWDTWNYARTDDLIEAISNRYVSPEVYGTDDLDHYGDWRVTPEYGAVWVPNGMAADWAPYSSGSWVWDPVYAWTWVDVAPWGWAPYHYGRWVNINGFWAWTPGPRHHRPAYSPALVAFFHGSGGSLQLSFGGPVVSWVALSWGEPCLPWWGRSGFIGQPWWGGWAGPRVVNNVVVQNNTVVNVANITYRNRDLRNAVIATPEKRFGYGRIADARRIEPAYTRELKPIIGQSPLRPNAVSFAPTTARAAAPAANIMNRPAFVLRRPPQRVQPAWQAERSDRPQAQRAIPENRIITVRPPTGQAVPPARFGQSAGPERNPPRRPLDPPRADTWSPRTAPPMREESNVPMAQERAKPLPQQGPPAGIISVPPVRQRQREPVPDIGAPPQAPAIMQRQAPSLPPAGATRQVVPQGEVRQRARPEAAPQMPPQQRDRPEAVPQMPPQRELRQERREGQGEMRRQQEAPRALPGRPANQLYQRRSQRSDSRGD